MASGYVINYAYVNTPTVTPTVAGTAEYGDNGPGNGPDPEFTLVTDPGSTSGRTTYNPNYNPDGSWDSGPVAVTMEMAPDGHGHDIITYTVNGETALTETIPVMSSIGAVEVYAGTTLNGSSVWSNLAVSMSHGSTEEYYSGSDPSVDTTNNADNPAGESELWVTPSDSADDTVIVTGTVEFTTPPGTYPGPDDLFAGINIFSGTSDTSTSGPPTSNPISGPGMPDS